MKSHIYYTILLLFSYISTMMAQQNLTLTFTAIDGANYTALDSIKILNLTKDRDTMLYWNDTTLSLKMNVGLTEQQAAVDFNLQAFPNPINGEAVLNMETAMGGDLYIRISDFHGRQITTESFSMAAGGHQFRFIPGGEAVYFIAFNFNGHQKHLKLINVRKNKEADLVLSYVGSNQMIAKKSSRLDVHPFLFGLGDELMYIAYRDSLESAISDMPLESKTYSFQFANGISCPGTPTVTYEGQVYNTIQIFSQCWLKENLNVGTMIPSTESMTDNDVIEKYCYKNEEDSCAKYGGLYQWDEVMQYTTQPGTQGICPPGWHIPDDNDWKVLEGSTDSQYGVGDELWCSSGYRGFDVGIQLKSSNGWRFNGNGTDIFDFTALPGGYRRADISFDYAGFGSYWWVSEEQSATGAWFRDLRSSKDDIYRGVEGKDYGFSVRCLKD